jgi:hypothetical protein
MAQRAFSIVEVCVKIFESSLSVIDNTTCKSNGRSGGRMALLLQRRNSIAGVVSHHRGGHGIRYGGPARNPRSRGVCHGVAHCECAQNIGFFTASAIQAAIHQSITVTGNLADVTAKTASQCMASGLLGTVLGVGLSCVLNHDAGNFCVGFIVLAVLHQG